MGTYTIEEDAAKAYDIGSIKYFGNNTRLNFPELREQYIKGLVKVEKTNRKKLGGSLPVGIIFIHKKQWYRVQIKGIKQKVFKELADAKDYLKATKNPA